MTYERTIGRRLKQQIRDGELYAELISGQWFQFKDANGFGFCQTDHLLVTPTGIIILECKLTQTEKAWVQLDNLYLPVLSAVYSLPVYTIQVCRNLRYVPTNGLITDLAEFCDAPRKGHWTMHWIP